MVNCFFRQDSLPNFDLNPRKRLRLHLFIIQNGRQESFISEQRLPSQENESNENESVHSMSIERELELTKLPGRRVAITK